MSDLPRPIQFDESSDNYRCFFNCFHIKTGSYLIAFIEIFLILIYFLNSLLILLQQKEDLDKQQKYNYWYSNYVKKAFLIESICLGFSLILILILLFGLKKNYSILLIPHLIIQFFALFCLFLLILIGIIALFTNLSLFYRLLNIISFNEFPGQSTILLSSELLFRVYAFLILYLINFLLEIWFIKIIYNCYRYFIERNNYMRYCLAYSTPLKTLNSFR
ncbi:Lysosomal-associated transmembrane protein [Meloidogyne graminicola]|uniref:Lysosomal-associated transmembrane protein n=1 Tax=Meloidogyne graminicola TaxID=189291 RepID=A0A8S9ZXM5_9BILA|nr:Lysosomal-associated transmembrane protein [Meloidogyne graminicola]